MRIGAQKERGTKWFRFLDAAATVLAQESRSLPASEIYARVMENGLCNPRFMPKSASQAGQVFRFDDLKRFQRITIGSPSNRVYEYGLKSEDG